MNERPMGDRPRADQGPRDAGARYGEYDAYERADRYAAEERAELDARDARYAGDTRDRRVDMNESDRTTLDDRRARSRYDEAAGVMEFRDDRVGQARRRFGGVDLPACFAGMLAAVGLAVILGGLFAALGSISYQFDIESNTETMSAAGFIAGIVTLVVAFFVGGWVAGRMARYDGGLNGVLAAVTFVVLAALLSLMGGWFGTQYDAFRDLNMPQWFSDFSDEPVAIISAIVAVIVMVAAAFAGGWVGERYHRRADEYMTEGDAVRGRSRTSITRSEARRRSHV